MNFSIRDLLLVTVIVAVSVAWWLHRGNLAGQLNSNARKISGLEQE